MKIEGSVTFLRHGETEYEGTGSDLTEGGEKMVKQAVEEIISGIEHPENEVVLVWESPTARTHYTAQLLKDMLEERHIDVLKSDETSAVQTLRDLDRTYAGLISPYGGMETLNEDEKRRRALNRTSELLVEASRHPGTYPKPPFEYVPIEAEEKPAEGQPGDAAQSKISKRVVAHRRTVPSGSAPTGYIRAGEVGADTISLEELNPEGPKVYESPGNILERTVRAVEYATRVMESVKLDEGKRLRIVMVTHLGPIREVLTAMGFDAGEDKGAPSRNETGEKIPLAAHFNIDVEPEDKDTAVFKATFNGVTRTVIFDRKNRKFQQAPDTEPTRPVDDIVVGGI